MTVLLKFLDRVIINLSGAALIVSSYTVLAVALLGTMDVILINTMNRPIPSAIELGAAGHVLIIFLALGALQNRHSHIRVDIFLGFMAPGMRAVAEGFTLLVGLVVFLVLGWQASSMMGHSIAVREVASSQLQFPLYPVKSALTVGCFISAAEFARQLVWLFLGARPWLEQHEVEPQA